ncbi:unnamed protein product [Owenia fusiformis]|uniref:Uncharacterized protein n=1 Tax=Owenia fusiformis TaxID=6347 RepID=A0A8J1UJW7_OWEFU|nr:unnamed protein product [Owenia fusiformis]
MFALSGLLPAKFLWIPYVSMVGFILLALVIHFNIWHSKNRYKYHRRAIYASHQERMQLKKELQEQRNDAWQSFKHQFKRSLSIGNFPKYHVRMGMSRKVPKNDSSVQVAQRQPETCASTSNTEDIDRDRFETICEDEPLLKVDTKPSYYLGMDGSV